MHRESLHGLAKALLSRAALWLVVAGLALGACPAVELEYVIVGDASNPVEPNNIYGLPSLGSVTYPFRMGKYEVTNAQYTEFLNAKAATDLYGLYDAQMDSNPAHGGIVRSGSDGTYTYATKSGFEAKPVVFVNFYDAARFANWLHNGQGIADTEAGAYTLTPNPGNLPIPANGGTVVREPTATVFLPNENEWYKAAYYQGGTTYSSFPTGSNTAPTAGAPPGGVNSANFGPVVGTLTPVGAYSQAAGHYGTFDQGGNVQEWLETLNGGFRILRGGHFNNNADALSSLGRGYWFADGAFDHTGFRVASALPPPAVPTPPRGLGKIMPLGDSLTQSQNNLFSYRYYLWTKLLDQGVEFDFVGTLLDNGIGGFPLWPDHQGQQFDQNHEGHSGLKTNDIRAQMGGWIAGYTPDVVLLIAGTNDALRGRDPVLAYADLKGIITQLWTKNSNVSVFLAKIPPVGAGVLIDGGGALANTYIDQINTLIGTLPSDPEMTNVRVVVVDLHSGFDFTTEGLPDGFHPNTAGEQKIAARFFEALQVSTLNSIPGVDPDGHLTMTFLRIKLPFQLSYAVEVSGNLQQWFSGPTETEEVGTPINHFNGTETVTIRDLKSPATDGQRFIRLRLSY